MIRRALLAASSVLLLLATPTSAQTPRELQADSPDVVFGTEAPLIQEQADALGQDPVRLYEFVLNEFRYEPYFGLLKGPEGTLVSRGGNDYDLAALLVSLLRASGFEARFVRGRIEIKPEDAQDWVGARSPEAARRILQLATPITWRSSQDEYEPIPGLGVELAANGSFLLTHVWVEARLPLGRYRGSGPDPEDRGLAWVPLDPSFKLADWPADPNLPIGTDPDLTMKYVGEGGYLSEIQNIPPASFFRDQLRGYLATNRPGTSVEDVLFEPVLRQVRPGVLPTALPYSLPPLPPATRSASLVDLHSCQPNETATACDVGLSPFPNLPESGHDGASDYHYFADIRLCAINFSFGTPGATTAEEILSVGRMDCKDARSDRSTRVAAEYRATTPELELARTSIVFLPSTEADRAKIAPSGPVNCSTMEPITVFPAISVDGAFVLSQSQVEPLGLCDFRNIDFMYLLATITTPLSNGFNESSEHDIGFASGTFVLTTDSFTGSAGRTKAAASALIAAREEFPVNASDSGPFVDTNRNGILDPSESFLSRDLLAQEALVGGLLELASARYWELARREEALANAIHQTISIRVPSIGLMSSGTQVDFLFDSPFAVRGTNLIVDIKGGLTNPIDRLGNRIRAGAHGDLLAGFALSAAEHEVWQEVAQVEAVSTVRGAQIVASLTDSEILRLDSKQDHIDALASCLSTANAIDQATDLPRPQPDDSRGERCIPWEEQQQRFLDLDLPPLPDNPGTFSCRPGCAAIDARTYCEIRRGFGLSPDDSPGVPVIEFEGPRANACPRVKSLGPSELIIAQRSAFSYDSFTGTVHYRRRLSGSQTFAIEPLGGGFAGGGHALDTLLDPNDFTGFLAGDPLQKKFLLGVERDSLLLAPDLGIPFSFDPSPLQDLSAPINIETTNFFATVGVNGETFPYNAPLFARVTAGDPVSVVNGNYYSVETDLEIRGRGGLDFRLVRAYNSRLDYDGPLGYGWIHTYDQHLRPQEGDPDDPDDDRLVWVADAGRETPFGDTKRNGVQPSSRFSYDRLVRLPLPAGDPNPARYLLTTKAGIELRFGPESGPDNLARLLSITDRNGNRVQLLYDGKGRLDRVLDTANREIRFLYDAADRLRGVQDFTGRRVEYEVDDRGDLVRFKAADQVALGPGGKSSTFEYYHDQPSDALNHNLRRFEKPERGVSMDFFYFDNDTVSGHIDAAGRETRFAFNFIQKVTTVVYPDGSREIYRFDRDGNVTNFVDANGTSRSYEFDERGNRTADVDGLGFRTEATYDAFGNITSRTNRLGHIERFQFNRFGQMLEHTDFHDPSDTTAERPRQVMEYDASGNLTKMFVTLDGELELVQRLEYDIFGNVRETSQRLSTDGSSARTRLSFNDLGTAVVRTTDPLGNETRFELDDLGRPLTTWTMRRAPGEDFEERIELVMEYDALGRVTAMTEPTGIRVETLYDANGLVTETKTIGRPKADGTPGTLRIDARNFYGTNDTLVQTQNAIGDTVTMEYDELDRVVAMTSPLGHTSRVEYDAIGNVVRATDPSGARAETVYDAESRPINKIDPLGRELRTEYDAEGRVVRTWQELDFFSKSLRPFQGASEQRLLAEVRSYDPRSNPLQMIDGAGHIVETEYDALNRATQVRGPLGSPDEGLSRFEYDLAGRLLSITERMSTTPLRERTKTVRYDPLSRVLSVTDPLGRVRSQSYDSLGNVVSSRAADGEVLASTYDRAGRLLRQTGAGVDDQFGYDDFGRLVVSTNSVTGRRTQYDALDRPVGVFDASFGAMRMTYDKDGQLTSVVYPSGELGVEAGTRTQYDYDSRGLLARVIDDRAGTWTFEYDAAGRPVRRLHSSGEERIQTYTPEGFLDEVRTFQGADQIARFVYSDYDTLGNPGQVDAATLGLPTERTRALYDDRSRLTEVRYGVGSANERIDRFGYDQVGNRILHNRAGEVRTYVVDLADQLTSIEVQGQVVERFTHDARGRRRQHEIVGGPTTTYAYDVLSRLVGVTQSAGYDADLAYDPDGARFRRTDSTGPPAHYFGDLIEHRKGAPIRVLGGGDLDDVLAEVGPGGARRPVTDGLTNITAVDASGTTSPPSGLESQTRYTAFGVPRFATGASALERGYAGRPTEGETGLLHLRARHYDPATGRFLQPDPMGLMADQTYAYAANNPFVFGDPLGLFPGDRSLGPRIGPQALSDFSVAVFGTDATGDRFGSMSLFDQQLGVGGRIAVAGIGATATLGAGALIGGGLAAAGCFASVVCGVGVAAVGIGALGYDLYNGGASRIGNAFSAFFTGDVTVGQALEVGAVGAGAGSFAAIGSRAALSRFALRTGGRVAEAAPRLAGDLDLLARYAPRVPSQSGGFLNVVTHADDQAAYIIRDGGFVRVSPRSLARFVRGLPEFQGQGVRLLACNAGACPTGLAQNLSNKLGVPVLGATDKVFVTSTGGFSTPGVFRLFTPGP